jgi:MraZ protein
MASIYGRETYAIDHKGRLSVPASMRRDPAGKKTHTRFFLKFGSEGCLQAYQPQDWSVQEQILLRKKKKGPRGRQFVRAFTMDACWVTVDTQGRITIPSALLRRAGLGKDAVLHGNIDCFEVWSPERFKAVEATVESDLARLEEEFLNEE